MSDTLVKVENVSKKFCRSLKKSLWYGMQDLGNELLGRRHGGNGELRLDEFWAVKDVSFELKRGECLGLIGRNGAGKTTLLRMLNGLIKPDAGWIEMRGRVGALIALGAGFNPILTGRENIYVNASVLGLSKQEIDAKFEEIVEFAELGEFIDAPVQSYSSGMQVRLGFAVATALKPDILLLDEVLAVGDTAFRAKCFERIGNILSNISVIFVSHDQNQIMRICDNVILLKNGIVKYEGATQEGLSVYRKENDFSPALSLLNLASPLISNPTISIITPTVGWGDNLEFLLKFDAQKKIKIGLFLIHFFREETFVSHANLTNDNVSINSGKNEWKIKINELQLAAAQIHISITIFSEDRKSTILHMINAANFQMIGHRGYGPPILHRASVEALNFGNLYKNEA